MKRHSRETSCTQSILLCGQRTTAGRIDRGLSGLATQQTLRRQMLMRVEERVNPPVRSGQHKAAIWKPNALGCTADVRARHTQFSKLMSHVQTSTKIYIKLGATIIRNLTVVDREYLHNWDDILQLWPFPNHVPLCSLGWFPIILIRNSPSYLCSTFDSLRRGLNSRIIRYTTQLLNQGKSTQSKQLIRSLSIIS